MPNPVPPEISERMRRVSLAGIRRLTDPERVQRTAKARATRDNILLDQVDPKRELPEDERAARFAEARRAHMTSLSRLGVAARRAKAAAAATSSIPASQCDTCGGVTPRVKATAARRAG